MNMETIKNFFINNRKDILSFFLIFIFVYLFIIIGVMVDLFFNPWLEQAAENWKWYNYFTSHHSMTMLYIKGHYLILTSINTLFSFLAFLKWKD